MTNPAPAPSPLPWSLEHRPGGRATLRCPSSFRRDILASPDLEDPANAALIVTAVNSHHALVEALSYAVGDIDADPDAMLMPGTITKMREALSLARRKL